MVFHGDNAQGKTNALEAIYLLATLKPLRGHRLRDLVYWQAQEASVAGSCVASAERAYRVDLTPSGRLARVDGDRAELEDYFAGIRAIAFTPADGAIVTAEPARRRNWLDRAVFTDMPAHLAVVRAHRRILAQKSAALRATPQDSQLLDVLDEQLARAGATLVARRRAMLERLSPQVQMLHAQVAGGVGVVTLRYRCRSMGDAVEPGALRDALRRARSDELRRRMPLVGPQTDEVVFSIDGNAVRTFGSQGQVRSVVLALKLAELVVARERGGLPLFLLDDVSSELDSGRSERLVAQLVALGGQVFVTTTDPRHVAALPCSETRFFRVSAGAVSPA